MAEYPGMSEIANELMAGYASAWNAHDVDALAALFHEDGTFVNVIGSYEKGREDPAVACGHSRQLL
jgi:uncharacterized protein (TIGR02246 family)